MTFSVAARCADSGQVGCIITSSSICVASRCAFVGSGVGVSLTQNITNPDLGPRGLALMAEGLSPAAALQRLAEEEPHVQWRQLGLLSAAGESEVFSGEQSLGIYATATGKDCLAMGNLLANTEVPAAMVSAFENSRGPLAERLLDALEAGLAAGGEMGPVYSAGLLVCGEPEWPIVNLRVDWHISPIRELRMVWENYQPQMDAYITRAKDPAKAESYGVPGDE